MTGTDAQQRRVYVGRCPEGCPVALASCEREAKSTAESVAEMIAGGLDVSLEPYRDELAGELMTCRRGHPWGETCPVTAALPDVDRVELRVFLEGEQGEEPGPVEPETVEPTPAPLDARHVAVLRSVADGDGVYDRRDLQEMLRELEAQRRLG